MKWIGGYAEQQKGENTEEWKLGEGNTSPTSLELNAQGSD